MSMGKKNLLLILLVIVIGVVPFFINGGAEFGGADGMAKNLITVLHPDYTPWFHSLWEPPSSEIESLLFALQAAIGSGFIAFFFGYSMGKKKNRVEN